MLITGLLLMLVSPPAITGSIIVDQLLAFTWIVGITNAFNLLDNMDGLSAGVAAIAGIGYLGLLLSGHGSALTIPLAAFVGAAVGFLVHNFPPASIFMGDGGSFFLGSFLGGAWLWLAPNESRVHQHDAGADADPAGADLRHGVRDLHAPPGGPERDGGRTRSHVASARGARRQRANGRPDALRAGVGRGVSRDRARATADRARRSRRCSSTAMVVVTIGIVLGNTAEPAAQAHAETRRRR